MKIRGAGEHQRDGPQYGHVKFAAEKLPRRSSSAAGKGAAERRSNELFIHKGWNSHSLCGVRAASRFDPMKGRMRVSRMNGGTRALLRDEGGYTHIEGLRGVAIMVTAELKEFAKCDKSSIPCKGRWCERWCEGCVHRATEVETCLQGEGGPPCR